MHETGRCKPEGFRVYEFSQRENTVYNRRSESPVRPNHAKSPHAYARNPNNSLESVWGNQALQRLQRTRAIQAKLKINKPGDNYEQEAERVTDQIMRMPDPDILPKPN